MNNMKKCRLNDLSVINLRGNSLFVDVLVFHQRICVSRPEQESNRERESVMFVVFKSCQGYDEG